MNEIIDKLPLTSLQQVIYGVAAVVIAAYGVISGALAPEWVVGVLIGAAGLNLAAAKGGEVRVADKARRTQEAAIAESAAREQEYLDRLPSLDLPAEGAGWVDDSTD